MTSLLLNISSIFDTVFITNDDNDEDDLVVFEFDEVDDDEEEEGDDDDVDFIFLSYVILLSLLSL